MLNWVITLDSSHQGVLLEYDLTLANVKIVSGHSVQILTFVNPYVEWRYLHGDNLKNLMMSTDF